MDFSQINFLAVLVAAIAAFALGAFWYNTNIFGKAWQKGLGLTDEHLKEGNMAVTMISSFVLMFVMALGMSIMINHGENDIDWLSGLYHGLSIGILFVGMGLGINALYERRSFKIWAINALYQIIFLCIMGVIIGAWK